RSAFAEGRAFAGKAIVGASPGSARALAPPAQALGAQPGAGTEGPRRGGSLPLRLVLRLRLVQLAFGALAAALDGRGEYDVRRAVAVRLADLELRHAERHVPGQPAVVLLPTVALAALRRGRHVARGELA